MSSTSLSDAADGGFHLGISLRDTGWHPGSWFRIADTAEIFTAEYWGQLAVVAERGEADFVTFEDSLGLHRRGQLDTSLVASWLGARTERIGLIPTLTTTHTEPFHVSKNLATLDHISTGRGGWQVEVSITDVEAQLVGRGHPDPQLHPEGSASRAAALFAESEEVVDVVRRLWDSWEDDAEIRDVSSGRFIDREKLHYINYEGSRFSVKGPSITPRPPQGQLPVAYQGQSEPVIKAAATSADILFLQPGSPGRAQQLLEEVRTVEALFARRLPPLKVYADLPVLLEDSLPQARGRWETLESLAESAGDFDDGALVTDPAGAVEAISTYRNLGFNGVRLKPAEHQEDVAAISELLLPALRSAGVLAAAPETPLTLRQRLGLNQAVNRYAPALAGGQQ